MYLDDEVLIIRDLYPQKAQYNNNETVIIWAEIECQDEELNKYTISMAVFDLIHKVYEVNKEMILNFGMNKIAFEFKPESSGNTGYGVEMRIKGQILSTAFDILEHWRVRPRYGFLSDFYKEDETDVKDLEQMAKYHINVVQLYDWMYKHEDLVAKEDYYVDLLNRGLSKIAIHNKIDQCHKLNMSALGYGAIYATSKDFFEAHKDWALYTNDNEPQNLGNWFYIMNISETSPWFEHIIHQFELAVDAFNFDGIHLDTYGFPKTAFSIIEGKKKLEKLNEQFNPLINTTHERLARKKKSNGVIFNAVSNWAIEEVSNSNQEAVYIEVWDPQDQYLHLYQLIHRAQELAHKQVILAAYLKCFDLKSGSPQEQCITSLLLTSAVIFASGGFHLVLGEKNGVLCDPYYVNYGKIEPQAEREVRNYYDFIVRYGNLLFDLNNKDVSMTHANGNNLEYQFYWDEFSSYPQAGKIWTHIRENTQYKIIQLVNMKGLESNIWNEAKEKRPEIVEAIEIQILIDENIEGVYLASPDYVGGKSISLEYANQKSSRGNCIRFTIPELKIWSMVYIKIH